MIVAIQKKFPNNSDYVEILIDNVIIGCATVKDNEYLVFGKRKTVPTIQQAAKQIIYKRIGEYKRKKQYWFDLLTKLEAQ